MALAAAGRRETETGTEAIVDEAVREALRRRSQRIIGGALAGAALLTAIACLLPF